MITTTCENQMATTYANPSELRARAKNHLTRWRAALRDDPRTAADELAKANNLGELADEAEAASAKMGRLGE